MPRRHTGGSKGIAPPIRNPGVGVSGQFQVFPLYPQGKRPGTLRIAGLEGSRDGLDFWTRQESLVAVEILTPYRPACSPVSVWT
jgi:hypothetical protein